MTTEENKAVLFRYMEAVNNHTLDELDSLIAANFIDHSGLPSLQSGLEGFKQAHMILEGAFPDVNFTVGEVMAEGDKVVVIATGRGTNKGSFFGIPPTGKEVRWLGIRCLRIVDGKLVEAWSQFD